MALDRQQIVSTALRLMDEVGLEGLSLRRLARELGVQAPALYWHFENKQQLIEDMAEALTVTELPGPRPIAPGERWEDWLKDRARASRAVLVRHRDAALLAASTKPRGMQFAQIELQLSQLVKVGFSASDAARALFAIGNYVTGFALEEQAERRQGEGADLPTPEQIEAWLDGLRDYPLVVAAIREMGDPQGDSTFEHGLDTVVEGLRARLAGRDREPPA